MSITDHRDNEDTPVFRPPDVISMAVRANLCVTNHRFGDLFLDTPVGRSPRLRVSRYYWEPEPPVAVDFIRDLRFGEQEIAIKKAYFKERNIRYVLAKGIYDGEGVEAALATYADGGNGQVVVAVDGQKPAMGPRRRK